MKIHSLSATVLVVFVQMFIPAVAQGIDQKYQQQQYEERVRQQACRADFDSAQYEYFGLVEPGSQRLKVDFNSNSIVSITLWGWKGCSYDKNFAFPVIGRRAKEFVPRGLGYPSNDYLVKAEGDQLVVYIDYPFGVERRLIGIRLK